MREAGDVTRVAGRGALYVTLAKIWFMVTGYALTFILARLLVPEEFGQYRVVINIVSIINAVIITGTYQTVSKRVSEDESRAGAVKKKALGLQALIGGGAALGFFLLAPVTAHYLNDARLVPYLRLASLITLSYAFYAVFTGYFNGLKRFLAQASLDATYSTLKVVFIIGLAWLGLGVGGAVGGFALAAASVLLLSALLAGRGGGGEVRAADLLKFQATLLAFTLVLNLLQKVDLILVKALSSAEATTASENAAFYSAAIDLANLTYQIVISATFVVFPLVSQSTFADDREATRRYIANTMRYTLMVMALVATLFSANASESLHVVYRPAYQAGAGALVVVAYGMLFFGALHITTTIITASGRPAVSLGIGAMTLMISAGLNAVLIPRYGLMGAGIGTTAAMLAGAAAAGIYLRSRFGALLPWSSAARIALAAGLIYAASGWLAPSSKLLIVGQLAGLSLAYLVLLIAMRELGRDELAMLKRILGGPAGRGAERRTPIDL